MSAEHESCAGGCISCADQAIVMRVLETAPALEPARCADASGSIALVMLDLVDAAVGDEVLVHGGVAIARTVGP